MLCAPRSPALEQEHRARPRRRCGRAALAGVLVLGLLALAVPAHATPNEVLTWNEIAVNVAAAGGQNGIQMTRTFAMVQGAVHDALNAITRRYDAYYFAG